MELLRTCFKLFTMGLFLTVPVGNAWSESGDGSHSMQQAKGESHAHASPHGGVVKTVGNSHVELVADKDKGTFELYVLGDDSSSAKSLKVEEFKGQVKAEGSDGTKGFEEVLFKSLDGTSHFVAHWEGFKGAEGFQLALKIPIDGDSYRVVFNETLSSSQENNHSSHESGHSH